MLGHSGYVIVSIAALLATASSINATVFSAIRIAAALADTGRLPGAFNPRFWRNGSNGVVVSVGGILLALNFMHLSAIASIASATFLIAYIAVHVAHWRLSQQTGGSRTAIMLGALSMGGVLLVFLWHATRTQPWSIAMIATFVAGSALLETVQERRGPLGPRGPRRLRAMPLRRSPSP